MNYLAHGATLALAWFLMVNLAASCFVAALTRFLRLHSGLARAQSGDARSGALPPAWCFAVRILPGAAASLFVLAVFVPSYWRYEPRQTAEGFDVTLTICAMLGAALLAGGAIRGAASWMRAAVRTQTWLRTARPIPFAHATVPAYEIEADYPLMALVGILRPRLLVTRGLIHALSDEELAACVAHEVGHSRAWDNLKRLAMRASPDALCRTAAARELEQRWASAAEHAADDVAGCHGPAARCALASALVKVARLMPERITAEPISTLIAGGEIAARVRRLLDDRTAAPSAAGRRVRAAFTVAFLTLCAAYGPLLHAVHHLTEALVHSLP